MHGDVPQFGQGDNGLHVNDLPEDAQEGCSTRNDWGKCWNLHRMVQWSKGKREQVSFGNIPC